MTYFLYRHVRLDNNVPFYIGIGTKKDNAKSHKSSYPRAFSSSQRNFFWTRIVKKNKYRIDIIFESEHSFIIKQKEIEFIKLYGRRDFKKGSLINNTDGGDGRLSPNEGSMKGVGKNLDLYREQRKRKVFRYDLDGNFMKEYESLTLASKDTKAKGGGGIGICCKGCIKKFMNSIWFYNYMGESIDASKHIKKLRTKKIGKYDLETGELLETFNSLIEAGKNRNKKAISNCAIGLSKSSFGYNWKYIN